MNIKLNKLEYSIFENYIEKILKNKLNLLKKEFYLKID
jgi:hypothetical protein